MSFILEALKKAESERNRRVAPVLMDARIASPRRGLPGWGWALGAVLLINLGVLAWLLLRSPASPPTAAAGVATAASTGIAVAAAPVAAITPPAPVPPAADFRASPALEAIPPAPVVTGPSLTGSEEEEQLPSAQELRAAGVALPDLQLNLHIYDLAPARRSVLLNGLRLREGEYTPDGVKVARITPQAVVLEASGRRFRLGSGD